MERLIAFAVAGFVAQLIDGALGMAYGVTATTILLATGSSAAAASATVHVAKIGTAIAGGGAHWRFGNVHWHTVAWLAAPGAVGAFAGATVLASVDAPWLVPAVAVVLLCLGAYVLYRFSFATQRVAQRNRPMKPAFLGPVGIVGGFIDAIGGGGWGPVTTPSLLSAGRLQPATVVGSVSVAELFVAIAAVAGFLASGTEETAEPATVAAMLAGGLVAAPIAAWAVHRLPPRITGTLVGVLIVFVNVRTLMLEAGVPGLPREVVLVAWLSAGAALLVRAVRVHRQEKKFAPAPPAEPEPVGER